MIITDEKRRVIKWDVPEFGLFEATILDGKLTDFRCCEHGSLVEIGNGLYNTNPKFLERVRDTLNDLLEQLRVLEQVEKIKTS